ncbi:hypothetical protein PV326_001135 [Microctonus aethiopoides]|nr:hypothetical protein PV326_001135 [Microctonus aethiopoides]
MAINGRGSDRPRVVHSPPRKNEGERFYNRGENTLSEDTEGRVSKNEIEQAKSKEEEKRDVEEGAMSLDNSNEDGDTESNRNYQSEEGENEEHKKKKEMQKEAHEEREKLQGLTEIKKKEKTAPSVSDIEKMLMKERIKVLEGENKIDERAQKLSEEKKGERDGKKTGPQNRQGEDKEGNRGESEEEAVRQRRGKGDADGDHRATEKKEKEKCKKKHKKNTNEEDSEKGGPSRENEKQIRAERKEGKEKGSDTNKKQGKRGVRGREEHSAMCMQKAGYQSRKSNYKVRRREQSQYRIPTNGGQD